MVRAFTLAVFHPCTVINDLISIVKEAAAGTRQVNTLTVMAAEHHLEPAKALLKVWELYERMVIVMLRLQRQLLADPRPAVARYASDLPQWLPSTIDWTIRSARSRHRVVVGPPQAVTMPVDHRYSGLPQLRFE
ncbi:hypothetical protein ACVB8X_13040 [Streptomyces sp. NRAIS4]